MLWSATQPFEIVKAETVQISELLVRPDRKNAEMEFLNEISENSLTVPCFGYRMKWKHMFEKGERP